MEDNYIISTSICGITRIKMGISVKKSILSLQINAEHQGSAS